VAYRMAPVLVTLSDLEGHSPVAGLFKCNPSNICAAFYLISTDIVLTWYLSDSWTSCQVVHQFRCCARVYTLQSCSCRSQNVSEYLCSFCCWLCNSRAANTWFLFIEFV